MLSISDNEHGQFIRCSPLSFFTLPCRKGKIRLLYNLPWNQPSSPQNDIPRWLPIVRTSCIIEVGISNNRSTVRVSVHCHVIPVGWSVLYWSNLNWSPEYLAIKGKASKSLFSLYFDFIKSVQTSISHSIIITNSCWFLFEIGWIEDTNGCHYRLGQVIDFQIEL